MSNLLSNYLNTPANWVKTAHAEYPYQVEIQGKTWQIRINDFPAEPMYTLLVEGKVIGSFDEWSSQWQR